MYVANEQPEELKNPAKAEKRLRIDHSRVHFENGKLTDMLHANLSEISAHHHRQMMSRDNEIKEIRQAVDNYKTILKQQKRTKKGAMRPQTSSVYLSQRKRTPSPCIKKSTFRSTVTPTVIINDDSDSDDSTLYDDDPFRNPRTKSAPASNHRNSVASSISNSSLRSGSTVFQTQLGRSQYLTPNKNQRDRTRRPGSSNGGRKQFNQQPQFVQFQNAWDEPDGFQMICSGNQTLSRRQLKQLTNVDRCIDDEKRKRFSNYYNAILKNKDERAKLDARVKDFMKTLMDRKLQLGYSKT